MNSTERTASGAGAVPGAAPVIAVLGLGEAGSLIARDLLAAGAVVRGFDPEISGLAGVTAAEGFIGCGSDAEACAGACLVLSVNSAKEAVAALRVSLAAVRPGPGKPGAVWADLNTASPGVKRELAELGQAHGIPVTDVAMMAPVPGKGLQVPMLASGDGADVVAVTLQALGADIEVLDGPAGLAATRKLLRSVFYKGMAASIIEALEAARAVGLEGWLHEHIAEELAQADVTTVDRIVTGTRQHAVRRGAEMGAAAAMLSDLGVPPVMASASGALHERVAAEG
jgi:3-hydroxyisobutyrate dehydrogenase-like beta-hydroxyacid dehydrogenase